MSATWRATGAQPHATKSDSSLVLMCLSAHPDDEDGATLAYYIKLRQVKGYSIFYTRGEGGQNEIGSQLYGDLGALRTKETLEAAAVLGTQVYFLGFPDFGFSKTAKETFRRWGGKDSVLARVVYSIRALKPDVIITNHDTVTTMPNRQHGNHQAVGITAYEAFLKAADRSFHPEQLNDSIQPWQVKKLYFRARNDSVQQYDSLVAIDVSQKDASGRSMEELAVEALRHHRSQGMEKIALSSIPPTFRLHRYRLMESDRSYPYDPRDLFSGISPAADRKIANLPPATVPPADTTQHATLQGKLQRYPMPQGVRIGLVKTYDNTLEEFLRAYHINFDLLDSAILAKSPLRPYTTIILDLRTYAYRHDAELFNDRLLAYVRDGGDILCMYHKPGDWNGKNYAPYLITLTNERVTEEDARVKVLEPYHPYFNLPNRILPRDWNGWVQERNIYLPSDDTTKTSARYRRLLAMSDEGEHQPPTSLLWGEYGKGSYTYVALALYRQLRILNPGAIKLFFNMITPHHHR